MTMTQINMGDIAFNYGLIHDWHPRDLTSVLADEIASGQTVYDALHDRNSNNDYSGLRIGDYIDVTLESGYSDVCTSQTQRFLIADVNPYYQSGDTATGRHIVFIANSPVAVASTVTGAANTSFLQWNTTANNNGTADETSPYLASNLKAWEELFLGVLPSGLSQYLLNARFYLPERYSSSDSALTDNNSSYGKWANIGKVFSPSEMEIWGNHMLSGENVSIDRQWQIFRICPGNVLNGQRFLWWARSPRAGSSSGVCCVGGTGFANWASATYAWTRPRPCFLLG